LRSPDEDKEAASNKISAQIAEFLASGGEIYQATSADNSGKSGGELRNKKQMIADQKRAHSLRIQNDMARKAASS